MNSSPNIAFLRLKKVLISEIAELIIPRTDTPGAKDAGVEEFIIDMIEFCSDKKTQNNFIDGLEKLEKYATNTFNRDFLSCSNEEKIEMLTHFENRATYKINILNKINFKIFGKPFIIKFKELTVEGYCTSQPGATMGLAYDYIPGNYESCITVVNNQKSWATK